MTRKRWPIAALALIAMAALISGCGSSAPSGTGAGNSTTANAAKAVKFARCMRKNGVSQFPDPSASGNLTIDAIANGTSLNTNTPAFAQALDACKELEPAGFTGSKRSSQQQNAALQFARCMRQNGVPDFPDPTPNGPLIDTNLIPSTQRAGGMSALNAARQKCSSIAAEAIGRQP
ncbi:MAG TPA: hypothetical protein VME22_13040 [Solirubrobacteraceae bacterium]|nr:hypothetical protein [Solirubrobacteraceae bacterium]